MKRSFKVSAVWDADAGVYYSESDIEGLHIEAASLEEFEAILMEVGPDLVLANHVSPQEFASTPLRELVPAIVWQRPLDPVV